MAYNGWANRTTWNISLWINNDPVCYEQARGFMVDYKGSDPYQDFVDAYGYISTRDGYLFNSEFADKKQLNEMMKEL